MAVNSDLPLPLSAPLPPEASLTTFTGYLEYDTPTLCSTDMLMQLRISLESFKIHRMEYADSVFTVESKGEHWVVTRKRIPLTLHDKQVLFPALTGAATPTESIKVRTLCLELSDDIQRLQALQSKKIYQECDNLVVHYIQTWALDLKMGFTDYAAFLAILHTAEDEDLNVVLKRHESLLKCFQVRETTPSCSTASSSSSDAEAPIARKPSLWDKIRVLVKRGMMTPHLEETAAQALAIGLQPLPAVPEKQTFIHLHPIFDAINLLKPQYRDTGRWAMNHIQVVTFKELIQSVKVSCNDLRETILDWESYQLLTINGKSQEWMAHLSYRFLPKEKMPEGILKVHSISTDSVGKALFKFFSTSSCDNLIMFDDGAYSGMQIQEYLEAFMEHLEKTPHFKFDRPKNFIMIVGFHQRTLDWSKFLDECNFSQFNINVQIVSNFFIENSQSLIQKEKLDQESSTQILNLLSNKTLTVTEWKRPDEVSVAYFVLHGKPYTGDLGVFVRHDIVELFFRVLGARCGLDGMGPIADIRKPY